MLENKISVIPRPVSMKLGEGRFHITESTKIESDPELIEIAKYLKELVLSPTGLNLVITNLQGDLNNTNIIYLLLNEKFIGYIAISLIFFLFRFLL